MCVSGEGWAVEKSNDDGASGGDSIPDSSSGGSRDVREASGVDCSESVVVLRWW